jgi:hypothetical protein
MKRRWIDRASHWFVWLLWLGTSGVLAFFVMSFGANHPLCDEWQNLPYLTGDVPLTWSNLCIPTGWGDHRVPLLRLVLLALARLSDFNFRVPLLCAVGILSAVAALMLYVSQNIRGRARVTDAFVIVVCLNLGNWENLLQGWNLQNVLFTLFGGILLACIAARRTPGPLTLLIMAACLVLMPWATGLAGLVLSTILTPCLAFYVLQWPGRQAIRDSIAPGASRASTVTRFIALAFLATAGLGAWRYHSGLTVAPASSVSFSDALKGAAIFLGTPIISSGVGPDRWLFFSITLVQIIFLAGAGFAIWRSEGATFRAAGLLAYLAAMILLAAGIGWGRSGFSPEYCWASRYVALATPFALGVYLLAVLAEHRLGFAMQWLMLAAVLASTPFKARVAIEQGEQNKGRSTVFERDIRAGMSPEQLAARHRWLNSALDKSSAYEFHKEQMIAGLKIMQRKGIGPFAHSSETSHRR